MNCTVWEEQASALVDGELNDQAAAALFGHLSQCPTCRSFYGRLALLREQLLRETQSASNARGMAERLGGVGRRYWKEKGGMRRGTDIRVPRMLAAAAVIMLMILGGSTTALLLDGMGSHAPERIIFVGSLPTVEVEASYSGGPSRGL